MRYLLGLIGLTLLAAQSARAQLTWTLNGTPDRVQYSDRDGGNVADLWTSPNPGSNSPWGIAIAPGEGNIYWTDLSARTVNRVDISGTSAVTLFSYIASPIQSLAYDEASSELFFVASTGTNGIVRSNTAGTSQSLLVSIAPSNVWLTLDAANRYLYFSEATNNRIARVNLDGAAIVQTVVDLGAGSAPRGVALDGKGGLYWVDSTADTLSRVNLNGFTGTPLSGGDIDTLLDLRTLTNGTAATPNGLASDGEYLYWAEGLNPFRGIYRADLSGQGGVQLISVDNTVSPIGVAVAAAVPEPSTILLLSGVGGSALLFVRLRRRNTEKSLNKRRRTR